MATNEPGAGKLELWGGLEATVNRVGDTYFDQVARTGHAVRLDDLDRFAALGLRTLRYPILWERVAPHGLDRADWRWADERLGRLRELGIRPIVGLCHHGSGPRTTNLLDPQFPTQLARFARAVAERYPWLDAYTPVNEPVTTARFAALYGHWYPHQRDDRGFGLALLHQCQGIAASMREIRRVNPAAALIQTEDLGKTLSTPAMSCQATFDNDRRWLSLDLLKGRVDDQHPMWDYLLGLAVDATILRNLIEEPCPPDLIGLNYYVTGERFLDHRTERYPVSTHGGNGRQVYADVEAVRVLDQGLSGSGLLLREAWHRYRTPIAVTEAHLGCTREEQLRWLLEIWDAANGLRADGVDMRAVTVWSLLGAYDWGSLLIRRDERYEPGPFDIRSPTPRPTALAAMVADLAQGRRPTHPVLSGLGWWRRPERLLYPPVKLRGFDRLVVPSGRLAEAVAPPILVVGGPSMLSRTIGKVCAVRDIPCRSWDGGQTEDGEQNIGAILDQCRPWAVIDARGYPLSRLGARRLGPDPRLAAENAALLATSCAARGIAVLAVSSDRVFDGDNGIPYVESDPTSPNTPDGERAVRSEEAILAAGGQALVVRTSLLFDPADADDILARSMRAFARGEAFDEVDDAIVSPTYLPDFVNACLDLLIDGEAGLWHVSNPGALTWRDFARRAADLAGLNVDAMLDHQRRQVDPDVTSWGCRVLESERGQLLSPLADSLLCYVRERGRTAA